MRKIILAIVGVMLLSGAGFAQGIQFNSITPRIGIILPSSPWNTGFLLGAEADLGLNVNNIDFVPVISYWHTGKTIIAGNSIDLSLSNFQIGADARYNLDTVTNGFYAGVGLFLNFIASERYNNLASSVSSRTDSKIGMGFLAGYHLDLSSMPGVVQARYNVISGLNTIELSLGIAFDLAN